MATVSSSTRRRRREGSPLRFAVAFALALLLHGAFAGLLLLTSSLSPERPPAKPASAVSIRPMSTQQWARNRGQLKPSASSQAARPVELKKEEEKKPQEHPKGQVVDVAPGNEREAPDAKYLAEHANTAEKETRAREQTPFYRNAMPQQTAPRAREGSGKDAAELPAVAGNDGLGVDEQPMRTGSRKPSFEIPDARRKQEVALKTAPDARSPGLEVANRAESDEVVGNSKRLRIQEGSGSGEEDEGSQGRAGSPGLAHLMPSQAVMDRIIGAAPNDHLRDVEEGDGTYLNTREWKYAGFFNRVKQSVGMHWNPGLTLRRRDPTGNIHGGRDRHTLLDITLDERGRVVDVIVKKSCGLDFLDLEAVESFKRAQPFPNPPPGLLDGNATVHFSFGFYLQTGGGPRMRLFRQQ